MTSFHQSTFIVLLLANQPLESFTKLKNFIGSENGLTMISCLLLLAITIALRGNRKPKLATSRFGGRREKKAARRRAQKQIREGEKRAIALQVGTLSLPDLQRSGSVSGSPGTGKTFSVIVPSIYSALRQEIPVVFYDFKYPELTKKIAPYAENLGYKVHIFAPGFPESEICNPLDFLESEIDIDTARELFTVLSKNFRLQTQQRIDDNFFTSAGDKVGEGALALAKSTEHPDLMTAEAIASLPRLAERLAVAKHLDPWILAAFHQLIAVKDSEKTAASILGAAMDVFNNLMRPRYLAALCGISSMPTFLEGKELLIFGMDGQRQEVCGPLLAGVLALVVAHNAVPRRKAPLLIVLDEIPTLYLPSLPQWINTYREFGIGFLLGFQNNAQLEKSYGRELSKAIVGACATKIVFNPQDPESARIFSDYLGDTEIEVPQVSRTRTKGKLSKTLSKQYRTRRLFEPSQFLKLPTGEAIVINPGFENGAEAYVPIRQKITVSAADAQTMELSVQAWEQLCQKLVECSPQQPPTASELAFRKQLAEKLLPLPKKPKS